VPNMILWKITGKRRDCPSWRDDGDFVLVTYQERQVRRQRVKEVKKNVPIVPGGKRTYTGIERYYDKKAAHTNEIVAIKAVSHKLARASYYVLRDQAVFDEKRLFA
jgi:hypothetical protein